MAKKSRGEPGHDYPPETWHSRNRDRVYTPTSKTKEHRWSFVSGEPKRPRRRRGQIRGWSYTWERPVAIKDLQSEIPINSGDNQSAGDIEIVWQLLQKFANFNGTVNELLLEVRAIIDAALYTPTPEAHRPKGSYKELYKTVIPEYERLGRPKNKSDFARWWLEANENKTPEEITSLDIQRVTQQLRLQLKRIR